MSDKKPIKVKISTDVVRLVIRPDLEDLKNFDGERILSRKYFEKLKLSKGTDSEILNSYPVQGLKSLEQTFKRLQEILNRVISYQMCLTEKFEETEKIFNEKSKEFFNLQLADEKAKDTAKEKFLKSKIQKLREKSKLIEEFQKSAEKLSIDLKNRIEKIDCELEENLRKIFSERLKKARLAIGLTQTEFAAVLGLTQSAFASYESGRREPNFTTLKKICRALNVSADWLLGLLGM